MEVTLKLSYGEYLHFDDCFWFEFFLSITIKNAPKYFTYLREKGV